MSKGDKRRKENFGQILRNWDNIDWSDTTKCIHCNGLIDKADLNVNSNKYIRFDDGSIGHFHCGNAK